MIHDVAVKRRAEVTQLTHVRHFAGPMILAHVCSQLTLVLMVLLADAAHQSIGLRLMHL
jgi:hypothetical protein